MENLIDIDSTEREFNEATSRLDALQAHLHNIEEEITIVLHLKQHLEANISILKSRHIITVAIEYKKIREELDKLYSKLTMLRINKNNLGHAVDQARKILLERREKYLVALEHCTPRVIEGNFRRKNDRQDGDTA